MGTQLYRILIIGLMLSLLSACGFHLRGSTQIAARFSELSLSQNTLDEQQWRLLKSALHNASVTITDSDQLPRLRVSFNRLKDSKLTTSSSAAVSLVQIGMQINFSIVDRAGNVLLPAETLTQSRTLELDAENVLSQRGSIDAQLTELEKDLIRSMLYKMQQ